MTESDNLWICIGYVKRAGSDYAAEFLIDARRYPDAATARAVVSAANAELQRLRLPAELEFIDVRLDEPAPDLPTWDVYHQREEDRW